MRGKAVVDGVKVFGKEGSPVKVNKIKEKMLKVVRKVNARAYRFEPEVEVAVSIDVRNGRIVLSKLRGLKDGPNYENLTFSVESAAKQFVLSERADREIVKPCSHPTSLRKRRKIEVSEGVRMPALVCTKCGVTLMQLAR